MLRAWLPSCRRSLDRSKFPRLAVSAADPRTCDTFFPNWSAASRALPLWGAQAARTCGLQRGRDGQKGHQVVAAAAGAPVCPCVYTSTVREREAVPLHICCHARTSCAARDRVNELAMRTVVSSRLAGARARQGAKFAPQRRPSCPNVHQRRRVRAYASQDPDASAGTAMSLEQAQALLGVQPGADFESIMRAKEGKVKKAAGDQDKLYEV